MLSGETQAQCATQLHRLGGPPVSQGAVSEWERGATTPRPAAIAAIREYCRRQNVATSSAAIPSKQLLDAVEPGIGFEDLARDIVGEPLLGPKQLALVEALTTRLRRGPPLSDEDDSARQWLSRVLRVE